MSRPSDHRLRLQRRVSQATCAKDSKHLLSTSFLCPAGHTRCRANPTASRLTDTCRFSRSRKPSAGIPVRGAILSLLEFRILAHHATSYPSSVSFITQQAIRVPYPSSRQKLSEFRILHKDTEYSLSSSVSFTPEAIRRDPRPHAYLEHAARSTDTTPLPVARRCARMITGGQAARWPLHQQCRRKNHHRPLRRSESAASSWQPPLDPDHRHLLIHGPEAISYESLKQTAAT